MSKYETVHFCKGNYTSLGGSSSWRTKEIYTWGKSLSIKRELQKKFPDPNFVTIHDTGSGVENYRVVLTLFSEEENVRFLLISSGGFELEI